VDASEPSRCAGNEETSPMPHSAWSRCCLAP